jgi:N-glycosylase/DNA lyase
MEPWRAEGSKIVRIERLSSGKIVRIEVKACGSNLDVSAEELDINNRDIDEIKMKLEWCLGLGENLQPFYDNIVEHDRFLKKAVEDLYGYRLLSDPTVFESGVKAICNQNTSFGRTKIMVRNLVSRYGYTAFPARRILAQALVSGLKDCSVGYRARYIREFANFDLERLKDASTEKAREKLLSIKGIGSQSAELILLRGLRRYDSFYVDLWIRRLMRELYFSGQEASDVEIVDYAEKNWGLYRGLALQLLLTDMKNLLHTKQKENLIHSNS